jgi:phosphoribosylamine--glycine ligase
VRVLVVGSGAREHALAWRLAKEGSAVQVAPGNGGTRGPVAIDALDVAALVTFAEREQIDLTIVGPEAPLAAGIVDTFDARGLRVLGPTRAAARLEWSKAWAKEFLLRHDVPTGRAEVVDGVAAARHAIASMGLPVALKADGLAAGKGVFIVTSQADVEAALAGCAAFGSCMLVEEYLEGPELSVMAFSDGERLAVMPAARDYKRLLDNDRGPNTGGMGGMARPSYATSEVLHEVERRVLRPTIDGMLRAGEPYCGVLYAGVMLTPDGPKVLEFNCRFGDPEAELVLPLLESSLVEVCQSAIEGQLRPEALRWRAGQTYGVVLAAAGYPDAPRRGDAIAGLDTLPAGVVAFHAGTTVHDGQLQTAGGRVLTLVAESREAVYAGAEHVQFDGKQWRTDIGLEMAAAVR